MPEGVDGEESAAAVVATACCCRNAATCAAIAIANRVAASGPNAGRASANSRDRSPRHGRVEDRVQIRTMLRAAYDPRSSTRPPQGALCLTSAEHHDSSERSQRATLQTAGVLRV